MTSCKLSSVIGLNGTTSPQVVRQTPPIWFVVDLLEAFDLLWICCTTFRFVQLVVQQIK